MGDTMGKLFIDVSTLPNDGFGAVQLLFLFSAYAYILFCGSNMISDGSELLLLVPSTKYIVGSVVLPVLGALPDGAIVLFSGLGSHPQERVMVGVGALAGSTIMLLTIPMGLSMIAGRVSIDALGRYAYSRPKPGQPGGAAGFASLGQHENGRTSPGPPCATWTKLRAEDRTSLFASGVKVRQNVRIDAGLMAFTTIGYVIIQLAAFLCLHESESVMARKESSFALAGFIFAIACFCGYMIYQFRNSARIQQRIFEQKIKAIESGTVSLRGAFFELVDSLRSELTLGGGHRPHSRDSLRKVLRVFFNRHDKDGNGSLTPEEVTDLARSLGESVTTERVERFFKDYDVNNDGTIDLDEFVTLMREWMTQHRAELHVTDHLLRNDRSGQLKTMAAQASSHRRVSVNRTMLDKRFKTLRGTEIRSMLGHGLEDVEAGGADGASGGQGLAGRNGGRNGGRDSAAAGAAVSAAGADDEEEEEEEEDDDEMPEDLADMSVSQQQRIIKIRSVKLMCMGTVIVLLFSDPMVDVFSEIGKRLGIPPFYVSFLLAPLASNASELIASYNYARRKTRLTMSTAMSALCGAGTMNNTFCLSIFLGLVYYRELAWTFSAETVSIVFTELAVAFLTRKSKFRTWEAFLLFALYPLSLILVYVLKHGLGWD